MLVRRPTSNNAAPRGITIPLVAAALLVAMLGLALILDRLWLEATRLELTTAAEASALAGARALASDRRLLVEPPIQTVVDDAVQAVLMSAVQNRSAGQPVEVREEDVEFLTINGEPAADSGEGLDDESLPATVRVSAVRTRFRGNPVALFLAELTRQPYGDAVGQAAATLRDDVVGVRPLAGSTVPGLPLAIWHRDPLQKRTDTWQVAIEQRRGSDQFGYDEQSGHVTQEPDGLPELTLQTMPRGGSPAAANLQLVDLGTKFQAAALIEQLTRGWSPGDLAGWNGELRLPAGPDVPAQRLSLNGLPDLASAERDALERLIGESRIALLYGTAVAQQDSSVHSVDCLRLVAIRVLQVRDHSDGSCHVTIQPSVLATRTALVEPRAEGSDHATLAEGPASSETPALVGPFVYRLELTQ